MTDSNADLQARPTIGSAKTTIDAERAAVLSRLAVAEEGRARLLDWCDHFVGYRAAGSTESRALDGLLEEAPESLRPALKARLGSLREGSSASLSWIQRILLRERRAPGDACTARRRLRITYVEPTWRTYLLMLAAPRATTVVATLLGAVGGALLNGAGKSFDDWRHPPKPMVVSHHGSVVMSFPGSRASAAFTGLWISRFVRDSFGPLVHERCRDDSLAGNEVGSECAAIWKAATALVKGINAKEMERVDHLIAVLSACETAACPARLDLRNSFDTLDYRPVPIEPELYDKKAGQPGRDAVERARWHAEVNRARDYRELMEDVDQLLGDLTKALDTPQIHCGLTVTFQNTGTRSLDLSHDDLVLRARDPHAGGPWPLRRLHPSATALAAIQPQGFVTVDFAYDDGPSTPIPVDLGGRTEKTIPFDEPTTVAGDCGQGTTETKKP